MATSNGTPVAEPPRPAPVGWKPPYVQLSHVARLADELAQKAATATGLAAALAALDLPAGARSELRTALKALGLVDGEMSPTTELVSFAKLPQRRPGVLRRLLEQHYGELIELAQRGTSRPDLLAWFRAHGRVGTTATRGLAFFAAAAEEAGLTLEIPPRSSSSAIQPDDQPTELQADPTGDAPYSVALLRIIARWAETLDPDDAEAFARFEALCDRYEACPTREGAS